MVAKEVAKAAGKVGVAREVGMGAAKAAARAVAMVVVVRVEVERAVVVMEEDLEEARVVADSACEQKSVHTSVSLGLREHGKKHERDERWEKEMSLLLQVVVDPLLCDEADDE